MHLRISVRGVMLPSAILVSKKQMSDVLLGGSLIQIGCMDSAFMHHLVIALF